MENNHMNSPAYQQEEEISLMDLLLVLAKHNRFIIKFTLFAALIAMATSLTLPKIYTAKTVIMPPQQNSPSQGMLSQLGALGGLAGGAAGIKNPVEVYVGILKSKTAQEQLVNNLKLAHYYGDIKTSAASGKLAGNTVVTSGKEGFITIEVSDKSPVKAAEIANAYVKALDRLNQNLGISDSSQQRVFFDQQLLKEKEALADAEVALKQTQERSGLIQLDAQGAAVIKSAADLRAQIAAKEVQLTGMRAWATPQNPDYRQVEQTLQGLQNQYAKIEHDTAEGKGDMVLQMKKLPESGLEYVRKVREVKYHETLFELLSKQVEAAKIEEAKQMVTSRIIDPATPPESKSKPKRALIVIISTLLALFLSILIAFMREAYSNAAQDPEMSRRLTQLRHYLAQGR